MPTLSAITYSSSACSPIEQFDLDAILFSSRARNAHDAVTGVLLVAPHHYFQYLEGPATALNSTLQRIAASSLHKDITLHFNAPIKARLFETWHMGMANVPDSVFLKLAQEDWLEASVRSSEAIEIAPAMKTLLEVSRQYISASPRMA